MADFETQTGIERLLFETGAIRVAPDDKPFWYTSGTIGPYYSNTQNLIGGEAQANELLGIIDGWPEGGALSLPGRIARYVQDAYENNASYRTTAEYIKDCIIKNADIGNVDVISGGARRDWFFSFIAAHLFDKPHLSIFKDLGMVLSAPDKSRPDVFVMPGGLSGMRCLHVSDLITEASSYERAWAPALNIAGTRIHTSLTILDRMQGGGGALASLGIKHLSVARLDSDFFTRALDQGFINERQYDRLIKYIADPHGSMKSFLQEHPDFIENAISAGGKDAGRARMCLESGIYI